MRAGLVSFLDFREAFKSSARCCCWPLALLGWLVVILKWFTGTGMLLLLFFFFFVVVVIVFLFFDGRQSLFGEVCRRDPSRSQYFQVRPRLHVGVFRLFRLMVI